MTRYPTPAHRLYEAAVDWARTQAPHPLTDAAAQCLADDLDSPHLRILAGAPESSEAAEITELLDATLAELGIPAAGEVAPWKLVGAANDVVSLPVRNTIRFTVGELTLGWSDRPSVQLLVHIDGIGVIYDDVERGMAPEELIGAENLLTALSAPRQIPLTCCTCGERLCSGDDLDATVVRDGDRVHWVFSRPTPVDSVVTFSAAEYDLEVARIASVIRQTDLGG